MLPSTLLLTCFAYLSLVSGATSGKIRSVFEWKWIDYLWDSDFDRAMAIQSGEYNHTRPVIIDVDVWKNRRIFVTMIRFDGVPASLTTITNKSGNGGPLLKPYPDWSWARSRNCDGITSVYRVAIDECDRLWVLDTGKRNDAKVCPAQLLAFDLNTDRLLRRVKIPDNIANNPKTGEGLLVTPIVETEGRQCERTHVYMADVTGNGLVVYNGSSLWRLESLVYGPLAAATDIEIAGDTFNLPDGVLGMALSPRRSPNEPRFLMSRPLASYDMVSTETTFLQNSYGGRPVNYNVVSGALPSQAVAMGFSSQGTLFFGLTTETALACWNMDKLFTKENLVIVDHNPQTHQFVSGLKVIPKYITRGSEEIWMATNRYQRIDKGTQHFGEVNFRIMGGYVDDLIANTNCDPKRNANVYNVPRHHHHHHHHHHHSHF